MYIIIGALIFAIIFYSWTTIKNIITVTLLSNTNITPQGFMWFGSLLLLNTIIFGFIIWFYYYVKERPGPIGKPGFQGQSGVIIAQNCKTC